jgi:hypothetical protein
MAAASSASVAREPALMQDVEEQDVDIDAETDDDEETQGTAAEAHLAEMGKVQSGAAMLRSQPQRSTLLSLTGFVPWRACPSDRRTRRRHPRRRRGCQRRSNL